MKRTKTVKKTSTLEDREAQLQSQLRMLQVKKQIRDLRVQMKGGK